MRSYTKYTRKKDVQNMTVNIEALCITAAKFVYFNRSELSVMLSICEKPNNSLILL